MGGLVLLKQPRRWLSLLPQLAAWQWQDYQVGACAGGAGDEPLARGQERLLAPLRRVGQHLAQGAAARKGGGRLPPPLLPFAAVAFEVRGSQAIKKLEKESKKQYSEGGGVPTCVRQAQMYRPPLFLTLG